MVTTETEPGLRQRVGGRWAISWVTFVVLGALGVVGVSLNDFPSPGAWLLTVTCATAALGAVFWLAHVTVLRQRASRPVPVWLVVLVGGLAGAARGVVIVVVLQGVGGALERPWPVFVVAGAFTGALGTVGIALLMDMLVRQRDQRAELRTRLVALREQDLERSGLTEAMTGAVFAEVAAALDDARQQLDVPLGEVDVDERLAVAQRLRDSVDRTLRPLSHRLYAAGRDEPAPPPPTRLRPSSLASLPVMPVAVTIIVTLFAVGASAYPLAGLFIGAASFVALFAVSRASRRWPWVRARQFPIGAVTLFAAGALSIVLVRVVAGQPLGWFTTLVPPLIMVAFMLMVSAVGAVLGESTARMRVLEEQVVAREVDAHVANREIARASRDVAQHVHGTLQSQLLATAFAIERAADANDDAAFRRAVGDARAALEAGAVRPAASHDLPAELDAIAALWDGFVEVTVDIDPGLPALPASAVADIGRIAGEAVANARKHGAARRVHVAVAPAPGAVVVTITDDGAGPAAGVPGMGSAWLDFLVPGGWSLGAGPNGTGTRLTVVFPVVVTADPAQAALR